MKRAAMLAAAVLLTGMPAPAQAATLLPPRLNMIDAPCPTPRPEHINGCAFPDGTVYFDSHNRWASSFDQAHEIGHVFDFELLSSYDHARFARYIDVYGDWTGEDIARDGGSAGPLQEDFADAYAGCLLHVNPSEDSGYGYEPTDRRQRRVCAWIKRVRARIP